MTRTFIYIYILLRLICLWSPASVLLNKVIIIIYQYTPTIRFIHPPIYYYCYIKPINARATVCCGSESKMAELLIQSKMAELYIEKRDNWLRRSGGWRRRKRRSLMNKSFLSGKCDNNYINIVQFAIDWSLFVTTCLCVCVFIVPKSGAQNNSFSLFVIY